MANKFRRGESVEYVSSYLQLANTVGKVCAPSPGGTRYWVRLDGECRLVRETSLKKTTAGTQESCTDCPAA
jgi:hypothetical protein